MDDYSIKLANSIMKFKASANKLKEEKMKKRIIFLENAPKVEAIHKTAKCQARTLENKPCPFRATCGKFCKRHVI